jgi:hypothetical protein
MERPSPQPGQKSNPSKFKGHIEKLLSDIGKKKSISNAASQNINSTGNFKTVAIISP